MPDRPEGDKSGLPQISRRKLLEEQGFELSMPPCDAYYMVATLFEIGPTMPAGMGSSAITHAEIAAWQSNTGVRLSAWEIRTLRNLSQDYLVEGHHSTDRNHPAPWETPEIEIAFKRRAAIALKESMRALAK